MTDEMKTPEEAARFLRLKEQTLAVWRATNRYPLPWCKIGRLVRYRQSDLERFRDANIHGGAAEN